MRIDMTARFLRERAVRCRRYADTTDDAAMRASLITLAVELEDHATGLEVQARQDHAASGAQRGRAGRPLRYYFNLHGDIGTVDHEGAEFPNAEAAIAAGHIEARILAAEQVRKGRLGLGDRIDVVEEGGRVIASIPFREAIQVEDKDAGA
jgi:hypothetical protein